MIFTVSSNLSNSLSLCFSLDATSATGIFAGLGVCRSAVCPTSRAASAGGPQAGVLLARCANGRKKWVLVLIRVGEDEMMLLPSKCPEFLSHEVLLNCQPGNLNMQACGF